MPVTAGLIFAGGSALYKGIKGWIGNNKANKMAKANVRPAYQIPDEYNQNLRMAQQMAQVGLPQQQYNNSFNNINRNQSGALNVLSNTANAGSGLASIVRAGNDATMNLDAQDANARVNNQGRVFAANSALAGQKLAAQQWNSLDKYKENAAAIRGVKQAAQADINGAVGDVANLGITAAMGGLGGNSMDAFGQPKYAGGNFMQRMNGGLTTPVASLPTAGNGYIPQGQAYPFQTPYGGLNPNMPLGTNWNNWK